MRRTGLVAALMLFAVGVAVADLPLSQGEINRLIVQLGSPREDARDDAVEKLTEAVVQSYLPLRRAAATHAEPAVRSRAEQLLGELSARFFGELKVFEGHPNQVNAIAVGGEGRMVVSGGLDGTLRLWDVESGQQMRGWENHPGGVWAVALSDDGSLALSVPGMYLKDNQWQLGSDFAVRAWDVESGKELRRFTGHTGEVRSLDLSRDQKRLLTASWDKTARLWDLATGKEIRKLEGHADRLRGAAFSPDGKRAVTASRDHTARVWDLETGKELVRFTGHGEDVLSVAFTPDGRRVLSAGADRALRLWDASTGEEVRKMVGHKSVIWSAAVSRNGRWAVSGAGHKQRGEGLYQPSGEDTDVRVWDLAAGEQIHSFAGHGSALMNVRFARDGHVALSCGSDGTIRSWRIFSEGD